MCLGAHSKVRGQFEGVVLFFHNMGAGGVELRKLSASAYLFGPHLFSRQDLVMESGVALTSQQFSCFKLLRVGMTGMTTIVVTRSYKQPSFYFCYAGDRA